MSNPDSPGRGTHSVNLRQFNERTLLQRLHRAGTASKADLARWTNLTNTAVGSIAELLERAGLIQAMGLRRDGQRGQPARLYQINPDGAYAIGVRLDRTSIETVLVNLAGKILSRSVHDRLLPQPEVALELVRADIQVVLSHLGADQRRRLAGIGLAQPHNLGSWLRELDLEADFRLWETVNFGQLLADALGYPVFGENDGTAAAIAELFFGLGRSESDFLYVYVGAALGGGAIVDGEALRGYGGNGADLGLMPVAPSVLPSAPTTTRRWDILMSRASLNSLVRHLRFHGEQVSGHGALRKHVARGGSAIDEWFDDCIDALVPALRAALTVLDLPAVVIDCDFDEGLIDRLMSATGRGLAEITPEARRAPRLLRGSFGADAGALGAATLPMYFNLAPRIDVLGGQATARVAAHPSRETSDV